MKKQLLSVILSAALLTGSIPVCTAFAEEQVMGDVNGDGKLSISDVVMLSRYAGEDSSVSLTRPANADVNKDGNVDFGDATAMLRSIARLPMTEENVTKYGSRNLMEGFKTNQSEEIAYSDAFKESQMDFAVKMLQEASDENEVNLLVSPISAVYALAMTANGAKENTLAQMEQVLGSGMDIDELNKYLYTFRSKTTESGKFSVANGIWYRDQLQGIPFVPQTKFLQTNADYFGAGAFSAPFNSDTVAEMDDFINVNTHGMIPEFFGKDFKIPNEAMMYLINCLAFEDKWANPYLEGYDTGKYYFTCHDGTKKLSKMMNGTEWTYLSDDHAAGFIKPYENNEFSFVALLPDEDTTIDEYVASLTGEKLMSILDNRSQEKVYTRMPKFSYDYDITLNDALMNMGMPEAFDAGKANFDGMDDGLFDLYISRVKQKTHIDVDSEGTKAAAVTVVEMETGCELDPNPVKHVEPKKVYLDRPFVYMILDNASNLPMFIGTLMETEEAPINDE